MAAGDFGDELIGLRNGHGDQRAGKVRNAVPASPVHHLNELRVLSVDVELQGLIGDLICVKVAADADQSVVSLSALQRAVVEIGVLYVGRGVPALYVHGGAGGQAFDDWVAGDRAVAGPGRVDEYAGRGEGITRGRRYAEEDFDLAVVAVKTLDPCGGEQLGAVEVDLGKGRTKMAVHVDVAVVGQPLCEGTHVDQIPVQMSVHKTAVEIIRLDKIVGILRSGDCRVVDVGLQTALRHFHIEIY